MKAHSNKQTEEEIDAIVTVHADDENAWDQAEHVHKKKSASISLPTVLAERAAFFPVFIGKRTWKTGLRGSFKSG